jgi:cytosine/uracil/thiamine/allantoin permease
MKAKRCRLAGRDLLLILCTWLLACWAILAALELPSRTEQTAGIIVAMAVVVMLTYLLAKATAEQELAEDPEESTDA